MCVCVCIRRYCCDVLVHAHSTWKFVVELVGDNLHIFVSSSLASTVRCAALYVYVDVDVVVEISERNKQVKYQFNCTFDSIFN